MDVRHRVPASAAHHRAAASAACGSRSGWIANSRDGRAGRAPRGERVRRAARVERHDVRVPAIRAISSAESGTLWRWAITVSTLPRTCSSSSARAGPQVGELLRREQQAEARRARPPEQPRHAFGRDRRELVDRDQRRHRLRLARRGDGHEVADDRRREHPREQRQAVGLEAEVHDRARADRAPAGRAPARPAAGSSAGPSSDSREDREAVARAREPRSLPRVQRVEVVEEPARVLLVGQRPGERARAGADPSARQPRRRRRLAQAPRAPGPRARGSAAPGAGSGARCSARPRAPCRRSRPALPWA